MSVRRTAGSGVEDPLIHAVTQPLGRSGRGGARALVAGLRLPADSEADVSASAFQDPNAWLVGRVATEGSR